MPDPEESITFWRELWDNPVDHNRNAKWIITVQKELKCVTSLGRITREDVSIHLRKMLNWKVSIPDGLHGLWLKKFTFLYQAMVKHLDDCIKTGDVLNWMVESQTLLTQKDSRKGKAVGNYRPIACLNFLWKLLTGIINENVYDHLNQQKQRNKKVVDEKLEEQKISS